MIRTQKMTNKVIAVQVGFNQTPIDYLGGFEYPSTSNIVVQLLDEDSLIALAGQATLEQLTDSSVVIEKAITSFIGLIDGLGEISSLDKYDKQSIIQYLNNKPTINDTIAVKVLSFIADNVPVEMPELHNTVTKAIEMKVATMSTYLVGMYFTETTELDQYLT